MYSVWMWGTPTFIIDPLECDGLLLGNTAHRPHLLTQLHKGYRESQVRDQHVPEFTQRNTHMHTQRKCQDWVTSPEWSKEQEIPASRSQQQNENLIHYYVCNIIKIHGSVHTLFWGGTKKWYHTSDLNVSEGSAISGLLCNKCYHRHNYLIMIGPKWIPRWKTVCVICKQYTSCTIS